MKLTTWSILLGFLVMTALGIEPILGQQDRGPREWTTVDGSRTLVAEYVSSRDGRVTIRRIQDRQVFTIDLATLSEADREWIKAREARMAAGFGDDAQEKEASKAFAKLLTGEWERAEGHGLKYRLYGDRRMRLSKDGGYPLLVYLHGRGGDVMTPATPGLVKVFAEKRHFRDRPAFLLAPQNPDQLGWNGEKAGGVIEIVRELIRELPVDEDRIYLTGYSMGAYGTFHLLAREPKLFAAGVPIAGGGNPGSAGEFKKVPLWVFHGAKDPTVVVSQSRGMVEALKKEGAEVKYTEYPEGDHGIAGRVYGEEELHEWLFDQRR